MEYFFYIYLMEKDSEIRITNVPPQIKQELKNIAKNSGVSLGQLLKPKLREIASSYEANMKTNPDQD